MEHLETKKLGDKLLMDFYDLSNRYFGDFHKIRILARVQFRASPPGEEGAAVVYERTLEQMGVPTAAISATRQRLMATFVQNTADYFLKDNFAEKYLEKNGRTGRGAKGYFGYP